MTCNQYICCFNVIKICIKAMTLHDKYIYIFGGTTGYIYNSDLYRLNLDTLVWEYRSPNNNWTLTPKERYYTVYSSKSKSCTDI